MTQICIYSNTHLLISFSENCIEEMKTLMKNSRRIHLAGMAITKLIHCDKLSEARNVFRPLIKVFRV